VANVRIALVAIAVLLLAVSAWPAPTVYIQPPLTEVDQGQDFAVSVRVDAGVDTLTCFLVEFTFDASVVELVSAQEGTLFAESGHTTMFDWDQHSAGVHSCNNVTLGFDSFVMCPGELVRLEFHSTAEGVTPLSITAVDLRDIRRERILPVFTEGGLVGVGPGAGIDEEMQDVTGPILTCSPNPFSEQTSLEFSWSGTTGDVGAVVYDVTGRVVSRFDVAGCGPGRSACVWDGKACDGCPLPGGVYFILATGPTGQARAQMTLVR
jgi:hypothetical protein